MNGSAKLMTSLSQDGKVYQKSIYAHAKSEIVYSIPEDCKMFASAAGLGTASAASSVIFKVYVDGKEKYTSGLYRLGDRVLPVVVDLEGGKELKLVVEDGGDGPGDDYAFWGEARFIKK
jgi:alpha-L-fucosidase 2